MPKISKPPTRLAEELQQAMDELAERLRIEHTKEKQRDELRRFIAKRPLLTKREVARIAAGLEPDHIRRASKEGKAALTTAKLPKKGKGPGPSSAALKIGAAIQEAREKQNLSRVALGKKLGCHNSNIGFWERGTGKPGRALHAKLTKVLGIPAAVFAAGEKLNGHAPG